MKKVITLTAIASLFVSVSSLAANYQANAGTPVQASVQVMNVPSVQATWAAIPAGVDIDAFKAANTTIGTLNVTSNSWLTNSINYTITDAAASPDAITFTSANGKTRLVHVSQSPAYVAINNATPAGFDTATAGGALNKTLTFVTTNTTTDAEGGTYNASFSLTVSDS